MPGQECRFLGRRRQKKVRAVIRRIMWAAGDNRLMGLCYCLSLRSSMQAAGLTRVGVGCAGLQLGQLGPREGPARSCRLQRQGKVIEHFGMLLDPRGFPHEIPSPIKQDKSICFTIVCLFPSPDREVYVLTSAISGTSWGACRTRGTRAATIELWN